MSIMDTKDDYPALRERFHIWCHNEGIDPELWMPDRPGRGYKNPRTQDYWMGWLQCAKAFGVPSGDAALQMPGLATLENVIACLRNEARYVDEEGEATDQLQDLRDALVGKSDAPPRPSDSTEQALGLYATQADGIRELLDTHAPQTTGNLLQRIAQVFAQADASKARDFEDWAKRNDVGLPGSFTWNAARRGWDGHGGAAATLPGWRIEPNDIEGIKRMKVTAPDGSCATADSLAGGAPDRVLFMLASAIAQHKVVAKTAPAARTQDEQTRDYFARISKDKQASIAFLRDAGILDDNGQLAEPYRSDAGDSNKGNTGG